MEAQQIGKGTTGHTTAHVTSQHDATYNPVINFPEMYFAKMYQHRSYVLALSNAPKIEGMWVSIDPKGHTFRNEGDYIIVCGEDHKCGSQKNVNHYEDLNTFSHTYCPNAKLECQWSAQDDITLDNLPYIGKYSKGIGHAFVATGFGKWGMTQSNIAGRIICDLILKKENRVADIYSPQRDLKPIAIANAIVQNVITAFDLVFGQLRFTCPSCAHLKCKLVWNKDEKTWDCPCHGSRFEENGSVKVVIRLKLKFNILLIIPIQMHQRYVMEPFYILSPILPKVIN